MKRLIIRVTVGTILLIAGFAAGRVFQHFKSGFHFSVLAEKEFGDHQNPVRWRYVSESVGSPFLDPGTSIIEYRGRTIYKAQRIFQEKVPVAANISTSGNQIDWDDGEFQFHLTVEEMKTGESGGTATGGQPILSHTNSTGSGAGSQH